MAPSVSAQCAKMGSDSSSSSRSILKGRPRIRGNRNVKAQLFLVLRLGKRQKGGGQRIRAQTGTAKVPKNRGTPALQDTQAREEDMLRGATAEKHLLEVSEDLKEHITDAMKAREELKESFEEW